MKLHASNVIHGIVPAFIAAIVLSIGLRAAGQNQISLVINTSRSLGAIDLSRYALGQGGLSDSPMFGDRVSQLAQLHPQTIRLFVQTYFSLYPAHGKYHWATVDRAIQAILATGATPIMNICFKPKPLYPKIEDRITDPTNYPEWEQLIDKLVKHCENQRYGIRYWEVGNEVDLGEPSGAPYKFTPEAYTRYYEHTAGAIRRADPKALVGGPALADYTSNIADALIEAAGAGKVPLNFLSWHLYTNDPRALWKTIPYMKAKLRKYPSLDKVETIIDEWNMSLGEPVMNPYFQPAFILETTIGFYRECLSRSAYYHIRDYFVDPAQFAPFMSRKGTLFMAHWWNVMPQYDGLYDNQDRVRPAYYAFQLLRWIRGQRLSVSGATGDVNVIAARRDSWVTALIWNFPLAGAGTTYDVNVVFPSEQRGSVRLVRLSPEWAINNIEQIRNGRVSDLLVHPLQFALPPYHIYAVELTEPN